MATVLAAIWLAGCATVPAPSQPGNELPDSSEPVRRIPSPATPQTPDESVLQAPPAPREFRAAWVTTIGNIDWPSRPGLSSAQQQVELRAILDRAVAMKLNAVILQVRPAADALYASELEPWSEYLTGVQGKAPEPYYDPLTLWVEEAHKRGLELHAWFNPFRAHYDQARSRVDSQHITKIAPELIKRYGEFRWMDPGEPEAVRHTVAVIADVVRRYDIDGVQIDDYFYPYPVNGANGKELPFPDESSWRRYQLDGGTLEKADWRRQNVNQLVEQLYERIHAEKHWVKFGISPFGLGRPDRRAPGIVGFSQYDKLYADVERWLRAGWVDYLAPQLYWPSKQSSQAFGTLLDGWLAENALRRHIWPGLFTSGLAGPARPWPADEILQQIAQVRQRAGAGGHIHFGLGMLMQDKQGIRSRLTAGPYAETALVPASPWLDATPPPAPNVAACMRPATELAVGLSGSANRLAVWRQQAGRWHFEVRPLPLAPLTVAADTTALVLSGVDRLGNESRRLMLKPCDSVADERAAALQLMGGAP